MEGVTGDLFAGEAKLFLSHPRNQWKLPVRLETAPLTDSSDQPMSLQINVPHPDMVLLCDSRMDRTRVIQCLCASDIGADFSTPPYDTDNAGRWANLRLTSDGRHWSDGEYQRKNNYDSSLDRRSKRVLQLEKLALNRLTAQLPPFAAEAVREGRAVVISRTNNLMRCILGDMKTNTTSHDFRAYRVCKSYGNHVYALYRVENGNTRKEGPSAGDVTAILVVGKLWQKDLSAEELSPENDLLCPVLTVARTRSVGNTVGGRVFCICLGSHLAKSLEGLSAEDIAKSKRHYEGYFSRTDCDSMLSENERIDDSQTRGEYNKRSKIERKLNLL